MKTYDKPPIPRSVMASLTMSFREELNLDPRSGGGQSMFKNNRIPILPKSNSIIKRRRLGPDKLDELKERFRKLEEKIKMISSRKIPERLKFPPLEKVELSDGDLSESDENEAASTSQMKKPPRSHDEIDEAVDSTKTLSKISSKTLSKTSLQHFGFQSEDMATFSSLVPQSESPKYLSFGLMVAHTCPVRRFAKQNNKDCSWCAPQRKQESSPLKLESSPRNRFKRITPKHRFGEPLKDSAKMERILSVKISRKLKLNEILPPDETSDFQQKLADIRSRLDKLPKPRDSILIAGQILEDICDAARFRSIVRRRPEKLTPHEVVTMNPLDDQPSWLKRVNFFFQRWVDQNPELSITLLESDVTLPESDVTLPEEDVALPEADVTLPEPSETLLAPSAVLPESDVILPKPPVTLPESEDVTLPETDVTLPEPSGTLQESSAILPESSAILSESSAILPESSAILPESSAILPESPVAHPESPVTHPESSVTLPESPATLPESSTAFKSPPAAVDICQSDEATGALKSPPTDICCVVECNDETSCLNIQIEIEGTLELSDVMDTSFDVEQNRCPSANYNEELQTSSTSAVNESPEQTRGQIVHDPSNNKTSKDNEAFSLVDFNPDDDQQYNMEEDTSSQDSNATSNPMEINDEASEASDATSNLIDVNDEASESSNSTNKKLPREDIESSGTTTASSEDTSENSDNVLSRESSTISHDVAVQTRSIATHDATVQIDIPSSDNSTQVEPVEVGQVSVQMVIPSSDNSTQVEPMEVGHVSLQVVPSQQSFGIQVEEVGLIINNIPSELCSLARIGKQLETYGRIQSTKAFSNENRNAFFVTFASESETAKALENFSKSPFGKSWLEGIVTTYIGTPSSLKAAKDIVSPLTELIGLLLKYELHPDSYEEVEPKILQSLLILLVSLDRLANNNLAQSVDEHIRLFRILQAQRGYMRNLFFYKLDITLFEKATAKLSHDQSSRLSPMWKQTRENLREKFLNRFDKKPTKILQLVESVLDDYLIEKMSMIVSKKIQELATWNDVYSNIFTKLAQTFAEKYTGKINPVSEVILRSFQLHPKQHLAELIIKFATDDQILRGSNTLRELFRNPGQSQNHFETLKTFLNGVNNSNVQKHLSGILMEIVSNVDFKNDQIGSIFKSKILQSDINLFNDVLTTIMCKLQSQRDSCEKWILVCRQMPDWICRIRCEMSTQQSQLLSQAVAAFERLLIQIRDSQPTRPQVENWARDTTLVENYLRRLGGHTCLGCPLLLQFLRDPTKISENITVNGEGRKCIKKILQSSSGGMSSPIIASALKLEFEEIDWSVNQKRYNSKRCGAVDVRKLPSNSTQSQFKLLWFDDALKELRLIRAKITDNENRKRHAENQPSQNAKMARIEYSSSDDEEL